MTWVPSDREMLACDLAIAEKLCPGFDPAAPDAWRGLIVGMLDNKAILKELRRLDAVKKGRPFAGSLNKDAQVTLKYLGHVEKACRTPGSVRSRMAGFKRAYPEFRHVANKSLEMSISRGKSAHRSRMRAIYEDLWMARRAGCPVENIETIMKILS